MCRGTGQSTRCVVTFVTSNCSRITRVQGYYRPPDLKRDCWELAYQVSSRCISRLILLILSSSACDPKLPFSQKGPEPFRMPRLSSGAPPTARPDVTHDPSRHSGRLRLARLIPPRTESTPRTTHRS